MSDPKLDAALQEFVNASVKASLELLKQPLRMPRIITVWENQQQNARAFRDAERLYGVKVPGRGRRPRVPPATLVKLLRAQQRAEAASRALKLGKRPDSAPSGGGK